jgi:hypothetical protein
MIARKQQKNMGRNMGKMSYPIVMGGLDHGWRTQQTGTEKGRIVL